MYVALSRNSLNTLGATYEPRDAATPIDVPVTRPKQK